MDEHGLLYKLLENAWVLLMAIGGFLFKVIREDVKELQDEHQQCKVDLANLRTHVSENYASKADIKEIKQDLKEMKDDIKTLIRGK